LHLHVVKKGWLWTVLLGFLATGGWGCSLTAERRIHKPIEVAYSVRDAEFSKAMTHLLGPPLLEGNSVVELLNGDQIFPEMLKAIQGAQRTITIEQYIWSPGEVNTRFVEALSERARNGVKVHIVVDGIGSMKLRKNDLAPLLEAGLRDSTRRG
jgi:cardiolipin synthase A/B